MPRHPGVERRVKRWSAVFLAAISAVILVGHPPRVHAVHVYVIVIVGGGGGVILFSAALACSCGDAASSCNVR